MAISMLIEGSAVEKLRWSFKLYDKDRDGAITKEEMLEIMQVCARCAVIENGWSRIDASFSSADMCFFVLTGRL